MAPYSNCDRSLAFRAQEVRAALVEQLGSKSRTEPAGGPAPDHTLKEKNKPQTRRLHNPTAPLTVPLHRE
jgi:hypothetical protein